MNIYIDCEFNGFGGELITMALVTKDNNIFYERLACHNYTPWVEEHVVPHIVDMKILSLNEFQHKLENYLSQFKKINIIADWPDDISYFCKALITSNICTRINTPPLTMEILRLDSESKIPHDALEDAKALCLKHEFVQSESTVYVPTDVIKKPKYIIHKDDPNRANILRILQSEFRPKQTEHLTEKQTPNEKK